MTESGLQTQRPDVSEDEVRDKLDEMIDTFKKTKAMTESPGWGVDVYGVTIREVLLKKCPHYDDFEEVMDELPTFTPPFVMESVTPDTGQYLHYPPPVSDTSQSRKTRISGTRFSERRTSHGSLALRPIGNKINLEELNLDATENGLLESRGTRSKSVRRAVAPVITVKSQVKKTPKRTLNAGSDSEGPPSKSRKKKLAAGKALVAFQKMRSEDFMLEMKQKERHMLEMMQKERQLEARHQKTMHHFKATREEAKKRHEEKILRIKMSLEEIKKETAM